MKHFYKNEYNVFLNFRLDYTVDFSDEAGQSWL